MPLQHLKPLLRLFDRQGGELAELAEGARDLEYTFANAGVFYLGVSARDVEHYDPTIGIAHPGRVTTGDVRLRGMPAQVTTGRYELKATTVP